MDDKLFMVWFVVSFAFRNQTRTEQELPLFGVLDWVARLLWSKERVIKDLCRSFLGSAWCPVVNFSFFHLHGQSLCLRCAPRVGAGCCPLEE
jgi:hypothetical protein